MRALARALSFGALVSMAACGGNVVKVGSGDGGSPNPNLDCPMASGVTPGHSCPNPGQVCMGTVSYSQCGDPPSTVTAQCTCDSQSWSCPIAISGGCAGPVCPPPSGITPGAACAPPSSMSCAYDIPVLECDGVTVAGYEQCSCVSDQWLCGPVGTPACTVDASAPCPDPSTVFSGDGCVSPGATCSGDPQTCGTTTLYDAVQCTQGVWQVVASTICDVDSGLDAETADGGKGI